MKLIIGLLLLSSSVFADVDYTCLNDCQRKGYNLQLCKERCSFGDSQTHRDYRNSVDTENAKNYNYNNVLNRGKYRN